MSADRFPTGSEAPWALPPNASLLTRRRLINSLAGAGLAVGAQGLLPAWARNGALASPQGASLNALAPEDGVFDLAIGETMVEIDGRRAPATTINGTIPGPLLRFKEGRPVTLRVRNALKNDTSIHWHGIILPNAMDGVPHVTFPGIRPGETFVYKYTPHQNGTYWYHSHSGFQEQTGVYGPMVIEPAGADPAPFDREYVVVLSDWTFEDPNRVFAKLKKQDDYYNYHKRTVGDFFRDVSGKGLGETIATQAMWGRMRMRPTDIADVSAATYTYLMNGRAPGSNWTGLFRPGERVRLRFVNASAMTYFNVRVPGLPMTVIQADGQYVRPVETDEFQISPAETYDVIVTPNEDTAYTIMAESMDRSGYARGTLAPREGMSAPVPALRKPFHLTMRDMGMPMDHGGGGHGGMDHGSISGMQDADGMSGMHDAHTEFTGGMGSGPQAHNHPKGFGVAGLPETTSNRVDEPGLGLENIGHRVLTYADLKRLEAPHHQHPPERELELHLTSNMERYMWSFDGVKYSEVKEPILFRYGERLRLVLVNDTMMAHPIHLHGMWMELDTGAGLENPRKHTVNLKPAERLAVNITADAPGDWAFHCHLLYHMEAGMFRVVSVRESLAEAQL